MMSKKHVNEDGLRFYELREKNVERCITSFKHSLQDWPPLEWIGATAGELGEAANEIKKLVRGDFELTNSVRERIGDELADTVIYLDLTAASLGIDLGAAIRRKFNKTSDQRGSSIRL
jgi:NTP pyrophosphatase (non-canonical NTP hydrolase)